MDKSEFKERVARIVEYLNSGETNEALDLLDSINWKKLHNVNLLLDGASLYEKADKLYDAKELLEVAHDRSPIGRMIIFNLANICSKLGEIEEAKGYYQKFIELAPADNLKYIIKYNINKASKADDYTLITILEDLKSNELLEEWAYELACLYRKTMQIDKCIATLDEIILWFGDGPYVEKSYEMKLLYKPLSREQEERYRMMTRANSNITEIRPGDTFVSNNEIIGHTIRIPEIEEKNNKYDTINLQSEIRKNIEEIMRASEVEEVSDNIDAIKELVEYIPYLQIDESNETAEASLVHNKKIDQTLKNRFREYLSEEFDGQISLNFPSSREDDNIAGQMTIDDVMAHWEKTARAAAAALSDAKEHELLAYKQKALAKASNVLDKLKVIEEPGQRTFPIPKIELSGKPDGVGFEIPIISHKETKAAKKEEFVPLSHTVQKAKGEFIVPAIEVDESLSKAPFIPAADMDESLSKEPFIPAVDMDESLSKEPFIPAADMDESLSKAPFIPAADMDESLSKEPFIPAVDMDESLSKEPFIPAAELDESLTNELNIIHTDEDTKDSAPDLDEEIIPAIEQNESLWVANEVAEMGSIQEAQDVLANINNMLQKEIDKLMSETQNLPEIEPVIDFDKFREARKKQQTLSDTQRGVLTYFSDVTDLEKVLPTVISDTKDVLKKGGKRDTGNIAIMGREESGKTKLAISLIKIIRDECGLPKGKTARISGIKLNEKDINALFAKIRGGALIIEGAGMLSRETMAQLILIMGADRNSTLLVIEDTKEQMEKLFKKDHQFATMFTQRILIPMMNIKELVGFGKYYAAEKGYSIDEMGVLALYDNISVAGRLDKPAGIMEVKDIIDRAIYNKNNSRKGLFEMFGNKNNQTVGVGVLEEKNFTEE